MSTVNPRPSMNEANERDPFNNNSYGTLVNREYVTVDLPILDVVDFNERVIRGYEDGTGPEDLPPIVPSPAVWSRRHRDPA